MARYDAVGFDLLTALLDTWSTWKAVAGDDDVGMRWHAASQSLLRGIPYRPFENVVRDAAREVGVGAERAERMIDRFGLDFRPWPDTPATLARLGGLRRFIVTNCSDALASRAAARAGRFELVMTAERAGAYKPDPRPYRAALDALALDPARVLFVAGSAHDVTGAAAVGMDVYWANRGGVPMPAGGHPIAVRPDLGALIQALDR